jgi:transposase
MHVEEWICSECGAEHTRDGNAAINLRKLGTAVPNQRAAT